MPITNKEALTRVFDDLTIASRLEVATPITRLSKGNRRGATSMPPIITIELPIIRPRVVIKVEIDRNK